MTRATDTWLEVHVGLAQHPKVVRFQAALDVDRATAIGHLVLLWTWALRYAPDGSLRGYSDSEVAEAAHFFAIPSNGKTAGDFVKALRTTGFLDKRARRLHDWDLYAGRLLEMRAHNVQRMREYRARTVRERSRNVQGDLTEPDLTEPTPPTPPARVPARRAGVRPARAAQQLAAPTPTPGVMVGRCEVCGFVLTRTRAGVVTGHDEDCRAVEPHEQGRAPG